MRRLFWIAFGAAIAVAVMTRGRKLLLQVTPKGLARQFSSRGNETAAGLGEFYATFKHASASREAELRHELGLPETQ